MAQVLRARSELVANREEQPRARRRIGHESFGVYRSLDDETKTRLGNVLLQARQAINRYAYWKDGVRFTVPPDLGITFVTRQAVAHAMISGSLQRGFQPTQFKQRVQSEPLLHDKGITVPIDELDWYGYEDRKLVAKIAPSPEHTRLLDQSDRVVKLLGETGAEIDEEELYEPDHVTLYRYGTRKDFRTASARRRNRLSKNQQKDIAGIVQTHLAEAGIGSFALGEVTVGDSYSSPESANTRG